MTTFSRVLALAVCLCLHSFCANACDKAAGVVAYAEVDEQILILIADHKINTTRGWGAFGGCVDGEESLSEGALRELHEETRCALPQTLKIGKTTPRVSFGRFTSYALKVPYISGNDIADTTSQKKCGGISAKERGPWAWIALDTLLAHIVPDETANSPFPASFLPDAKRRWFWSKSMRVIRALHQRNGFE